MGLILSVCEHGIEVQRSMCRCRKTHEPRLVSCPNTEEHDRAVVLELIKKAFEITDP